MFSPLLHLHDEDVASAEFLPATSLLKTHELCQEKKESCGLVKKTKLFEQCVWFLLLELDYISSLGKVLRSRSQTGLVALGGGNY